MPSSSFPLSLANRLTLRHFRQRLPRSRRSSFSASAHTILNAEWALQPDPVTRGHIVFATALITSVEQWENTGLTREDAKTHTRDTVLKYGGWSSAISMWLTEQLAKDPFETVRTYSLDKSRDAYGPTFKMSTEEEPDSFASIVHTCGYRAFLARHDADGLIDLFCAWDRVWIERLPKGIRFARPTTIAGGAKTCRFEFYRE